MKKSRNILYLTALLLLASLLFCACGAADKNAEQIVGMWRGDGNLDVTGIGAPFEYAKRLVFNEDGSGLMSGDTGTLTFTYVLTDDTLTLRFSEISWGLPYTVNEYDLTLGSKASRSVFTRMHQ